MPAYNAESTLEKTVADIPAGVADRLILVDDASPDNTAQLAQALGIDVRVHPENRGYGGNQKTCYRAALEDAADIIVMLHPDYQYEPKAVPLLLAPILAGDADLTFGSRFAGLGDPRGGGMPIHRFVGNRVTTVIENLLLATRFSEMHSGMRAYTRRCLLSLPFLRYSDDFLFDSQLLIDAVTTGQRVIEVPIPTRYTEESSSIGALRSLSYVSRSIGYCARRVARHGRRAHRSPIGRRAAGTPPSLGGAPVEELHCVLCGDLRVHQRAQGALRRCIACGLVSRARSFDRAPEDNRSADHRFLDSILDAMEGYVVGGRRLLATSMTPSLERRAKAARWDISGVRSGAAARRQEAQRFDAVLVPALTPELRDYGSGLAGLRAELHDEGLLVLVAPVAAVSAGSLDEHPYSVSARPMARALREADLRLVEWSYLPRSLQQAYRRWLPDGSGVCRPRHGSGVVVAVARAEPRPSEGRERA